MDNEEQTYFCIQLLSFLKLIATATFTRAVHLVGRGEWIIFGDCDLIYTPNLSRHFVDIHFETCNAENQKRSFFIGVQKNKKKLQNILFIAS